MGDTTAANFDYITEPIKHAYDTARQALHDASIGAGSKRGILILGIANAGKTRLAFEALTQTLPDWNVFSGMQPMIHCRKFQRTNSFTRLRPGGLH